MYFVIGDPIHVGMLQRDNLEGSSRLYMYIMYVVLLRCMVLCASLGLNTTMVEFTEQYVWAYKKHLLLANGAADSFHRKKSAQAADIFLART